MERMVISCARIQPVNEDETGQQSSKSVMGREQQQIKDLLNKRGLGRSIYLLEEREFEMRGGLRN